MGHYRFFPRADKAQNKIWQDTCDHWGEEQADRYILGLHAHLKKLGETQSLWRRLPTKLTVPEDLTIVVYFSRYQHHILFFRVLSDGAIGIISILHERMDLPARLKEDLAALETRKN